VLIPADGETVATGLKISYACIMVDVVSVIDVDGALTEIMALECRRERPTGQSVCCSRGYDNCVRCLDLAN
jgi:hypothetical protein